MWITVILCLLPGIYGKGPVPTTMCRSCQQVDNHHDCLVFEECHSGHCGIQAHQLDDGRVVLSYSCMTDQECTAETSTVGHVKRGGHHHQTLVCRECCDTPDCDLATCEQFVTNPHGHHAVDTTTVPHGHHHPHTTTSHTSLLTTTAAGHHHNHVHTTVQQASTTVATTPPLTTLLPSTTTTAPATTTIDTSCRNHETSFKCTDFDAYNFCTDPSSLAHQLAYEHCRLHCGFCTDTTVSTATPYVGSPTSAASSCVDIGDTHFTCAEWLLFGFCDPSSGTGYEIAQLRCRKTCGLCT